MEHLLNPFTKSMGEAAYVGAYRVSWPLSIFHPFMDFVGYVELTEWFFCWHVNGGICISCPFYRGVFDCLGARIGWFLSFLGSGYVHFLWLGIGMWWCR